MAKKKGKSKRARSQDSTKSQKPVVKAPQMGGTPWGIYAAVLAVAIAAGYFLTRPKQQASGPAPDGPDSPSAAVPTPVTHMYDAEKIHADYAGSESCRNCHEEQFNEWTGSHHQLAERLTSAGFDDDAFKPKHTFRTGSITSTAQKADDQYQIVTVGKNNKIQPHSAKRAIGVKPLLQYLVEEERGRLQAVELGWDPHKKEWFNVFGDEDRRPGEWGHWTGRGMNWNAMCASCHNTRVLKNYNASTDTYHTKMAEMGVGCESCHGPMKEHAKWQEKYKDQPGKSATDPTLPRFSRDQYTHSCAPCHARRTELTGDYIPGHDFFDHYSLVIPDETDIFYPDGQVRDEDYEVTSFFSSRMHAGGVRCMDCHNPHTGKTRLPGNLLCMTCHNGQNPDLPNIPKIDPIKHSFHKSETEPGGRCVDCHMPLTTYMQRHPRRDHGFTIPDPLLTKQHGIPNACNRCHDDKTTDWAIEYVDKWYGDKMDRPYRKRAQWVAMAKTNAPGSHINLINMSQTETNFLWRSVSAGLLRNYLHEPDAREELLKRLTDKHPLVRGTAVLSLEPIARQSGTREHSAVRNLLDDPSRKVRIDAAWVLRSIVNTNQTAGRELLTYFAQTGDQPAGQMQQGVFHFDRQRPDVAEQFFRQAGKWDTNTAAPHHELAVALSLQGKNRDAIKHLRIACQLDPDQAEYRYKLALGLNEIGDTAGTRRELEAAVKIDPQHGPAWYNLGLSLSNQNLPNAAIAALEKAQEADRLSARIPHARATILMRLNRIEEAREAVRLALTLDADYQPARALWQQLGRAK